MFSYHIQHSEKEFTCTDYIINTCRGHTISAKKLTLADAKFGLEVIENKLKSHCSCSLFRGKIEHAQKRFPVNVHTLTILNETTTKNY